jgi:hypothetical protein
MSRGRPGGNPDLANFQFTTDRDEPLSEKITIRISPSMLRHLQGLDNYREFCRKAIAEKLEQMETAPKTRTETP